MARRSRRTPALVHPATTVPGSSPCILCWNLLYAAGRFGKRRGLSTRACALAQDDRNEITASSVKPSVSEEKFPSCHPERSSTIRLRIALRSRRTPALVHPATTVPGSSPWILCWNSCKQHGGSESAGVFRLGHAPSLNMRGRKFGCRARSVWLQGGSVAGTRIGRLLKYP